MKLINPLLTLAALTALTGCTSSDVIDDVTHSPANRIGFNTTVSVGSRAVTNASFNKFFVFATYTVPTQTGPVNVFYNELVSKGSDGKWTYDGDRYWIPEGSYDFYAYSCENEELDANVTGTHALNGRVLNLNSVRSDAKHQHDLLFAKVTGQTRTQVAGQTPAPVAFKFAHILARVRFSFRSSFPEGYKVSVSNVRLDNFRDVGTFKGETETWEDVDRSTTGPQMTLRLPSTSTDITSAPGQTEPCYVIPFSYAQANVRLIFDVNVTKNGEAVLGRTITASWIPVWKAGHSINNEITINGGRTGLDKISFTASIVGATGSDADGWNEDTGTLNGLQFSTN